MDPIIALILIEQTIATVVIATAIVIYSRATTRILEAHIEPELHVTLQGGPQSNSLTITNSAGCAVSNLNVIVSAGCTWGPHPYPPRHCLYFGSWEMIAPGSLEKPVDQPLKPEAFAAAQLPEGAKLDLNDIFVEYSFTRRADNRRYAFKYQLGIFKQSDDKSVYLQMEQPKMLRVTRCDSDEATGKPGSLGSAAVSVIGAGPMHQGDSMQGSQSSAYAGFAATAAAPCIG